MTDTTAPNALKLLSEGLDLCVRGRRLDETQSEIFVSEITGTQCGTIPLWVAEQYDTDLADWESRARNFLVNSGSAS